MSLAYKARCLAEVTRAIKQSRAGAERERWERERLERWQRERLNELVAYAVENSPFWQARLGRPHGEIRLHDLPVLDKPTMMEHFDELVTDRRLRRDALLEHRGARPRCALPRRAPRDDHEWLIRPQWPLRLRPPRLGGDSWAVLPLQHVGG